MRVNKANCARNARFVHHSVPADGAPLQMCIRCTRKVSVCAVCVDAMRDIEKYMDCNCANCWLDKEETRIDWQQRCLRQTQAGLIDSRMDAYTQCHLPYHISPPLSLSLSACITK